MMLEPPRRGGRARRRRPGTPRRRRARGPARSLPDWAPSTCTSSGWSTGCRSGATRSAASCSRSACSCPTGRTRCTSATGSSRAARDVRLRLRPAVHFRGHEAALGHPARAAVRADRGRRRLRDLRRARTAHAPPARARAPRPRSPSRRAPIPEVAYRVEEDRGYDARGELWSPGYFGVDLDARPDGDAGRVHRALGDDAGPPARGGARRWSSSGGARLIAVRGPGRRGRASPPSWCWPPTSSSSPRPAASRTPPAPAPRATRCARSSPATTGSRTGAATP